MLNPERLNEVKQIQHDKKNFLNKFKKHRMLINIHTHNKQETNFAIINLFPEEVETIEKTKLYSVGIHPWEVSKIDCDRQIETVKKTASLKNVLAIGEIGLDKLHPGFELQKEVFLKQINIAKEIEKPIIIHCVKVYSELLEILKKEQLKIPVIIHRYSGNITIAGELLKFGCFLSFGHELFNNKSKTPKVFKKIPVENLFLETDDAEISIEDVYRKASELKNLPVETLKNRILQNYKTVFKI